MKKRGFISHIHEEAQVAEYVKEFITGIFLGELDLFVSSLDISTGEWLKQIRSALQDTHYVFPLLSRVSKDRPWVSFESGAAFIVEPIELIPLCHAGLATSELRAPFSHFQAYDLTKPKNVSSLIRSLASDLGLLAPKVNAQEFCRRIMKLDGLIYRFFDSFDELAAAIGLATDPTRTARASPIQISSIQIWDELELRARLHEGRTIELNGHTTESCGFSLVDLHAPSGATFLVAKLANTSACVSDDLGKMLIVAINRRRVKTSVESHRHYSDPQFIVQGDGLFAFELPELAKRSGKVSLVDISFWKIDIRDLLIEFFFV